MKYSLILFTFYAVSTASAGQGVVLQSGEVLNFITPAAIPYSSISSTRVEMRFHAWTAPAGTANLVTLPGFGVRLAGPGFNAPLIVNDWVDSFTEGQGNAVYLNISGMSDLIVRVQRDTVGMTFNVQAWEANGNGTTVSASLPIDALGSATLPAKGTFGDPTMSSVLDYARWFSQVVPPANGPTLTATGDLADFEFEGNLKDGSPQHLLVTSSQTPVFAGAPLYVPVCSQGAQRVLRANVPEVLRGTGSYSLNGSPQLTYQWSQISGPTTLSWNSTTSVTPTITGLAFGSYTILLTVTDSSGQTSSSTIKYGSVYTDSNDIVIPSDPNIVTVFGPMLRLGASPWPYFDQSHQQMADFFGGLQGSDYLDVWNTSQAGSVSVVNGSAIVTGMNTNFQSAFCGGGNLSVNGSSMIVWYPVPNSPGAFGRSPYAVASCESATSLTLTQPYLTGAGATGLSFASMNNNSIGIWINGSSNANYYDNVMAFYNLYYRSGIDDYQTYARTLADRWYTMPWFDQGRASQSGSTTLLPRLQALTGLMLRAMDGQPQYWSGIEQYVTWDYSFADVKPGSGYILNDVREQGYATAFLALAAMLDPKPANQAVYQTELAKVISDVWAPALQPAGNWVNLSNGVASWNGSAGTVNVTHGSTLVTGVGTQWQQAWFAGNSFWTANSNGYSNGDAIAYTATATAPNQITLNIPYQGSTASARGWQSNGLVGVGTEPFMLGVVAQAFRLAFEANANPQLPGYLAQLEQWLSTEGYRPDARGLWYGRTFPNCEPISVNNAACSGGTVEQSRFLSGEVMGALSATYLSSGNPAIQAFGDNLFGAMFGGPTGGPDSDNIFVTDVSVGGWAEQTKYAKDFGFFFGFGGGPSWLAARLDPKIAQQAPRTR